MKVQDKRSLIGSRSGEREEVNHVRGSTQTKFLQRTVFFLWTSFAVILCAKDVGHGKRRKTALDEADERERQEQQERNTTNSEKTDVDQKQRGRDTDHDICVISWNVNKSFAQCDVLCDVAQCQANVPMFPETQNWQPDGTAGELGMDSAEKREAWQGFNCRQTKGSESSETLSKKH